MRGRSETCVRTFAAAVLAASCSGGCASERIPHEATPVSVPDEVVAPNTSACLEAFFAKERPQTPPRKDPDRLAEAIGCFRSEDSSRPEKLALGRKILTRHRAYQFTDEYAPFLIEAVLNGGEEEFFATRVSHSLTAVGEYAFLASGFEGHSRRLFGRIRDERVIPLLIKCLDAPDTVFGEQSGCIRIIGVKPGDPTGRNVARQEIPIALARLGAREAIPAMKRIVSGCGRDLYLRQNCAFALGCMLPPDETERLMEELSTAESLRPFLVFEFGKGMVAAGHLSGLRHISVRTGDIGRFDFEWKDATVLSILHNYRERLFVVRGLRNPALETFYRELLAFRPFHRLILFNPRGVHFRQGETYWDREGRPRTVGNGKDALVAYKLGIVNTYSGILAEIRANEFRTLAPVVRKIASRTRSPDIRRASEECLAEMR